MMNCLSKTDDFIKKDKFIHKTDDFIENNKFT